MIKLLISIPTYKRPNELFQMVRSYINIFRNKENYDVTISIFNQDGNTNIKSFIKNCKIEEITSERYDLSVNSLSRIRFDALTKANYKYYDFVLLSDDDAIVIEDKVDEAFNYYDKIFKEMSNNPNHLTSSCFYSNAFRTVHNPITYPGTQQGIIIKNEKGCISKIFSPEIFNIKFGEDIFIFLKTLVLGYDFVVYGGFKSLFNDAFKSDNHTVGGLNLNLQETVKSDLIYSDRKNIFNKETCNFQHLYYDFMHYESAYGDSQRIRSNIREYINKNIWLDEQGNIRRISEDIEYMLMPYNSSERPYFKGGIQKYEILKQLIKGTNENTNCN